MPASGSGQDHINHDEAKKRIDRTLTWLNANGGLKQQIDWGKVHVKLKKLPYGQANRILKDVGERAAEIKDPTMFVISRCNELGACGSKEQVRKINMTIWWLNHEGGFGAKGKAIICEEVTEPLARVKCTQSMKILHELGE